MAAARAQIAEFDQNRRKGPKWGLGSKKSRESAEPHEDVTRQHTPAEPYQEPDYDRPDGRDAGREVLAAFAETIAEAQAQARVDAQSEAAATESGRGLGSIRGAKAKRGKHAPDPAGTPSEPPASDRPRLRLAGPAPTAEPKPRPPVAPTTPPAVRQVAAEAQVRPPASRAPERARGSGARDGSTGRPRASFSMNVDFKPRTTTRTILTLLLLLALTGAVLTGLTLREDQNTLNVGLTATLAVLTLFVYSIRAGAATSHLRVRGGLLEIKRGGRREVFDLSSRFTPIDVVGRVNRSGWKVIMLRTDGTPQMIDSSIVDPKHFMEVLLHYRPDLDPDL